MVGIDRGVLLSAYTQMRPAEWPLDDYEEMGRYHMAFDYGNKKSNGQYERYPSDVQPKFVQPIRHKYIHNKCGVETVMRGEGLAETYATNPSYYSHTFCVYCREHLPIEEFRWSADGVPLNEVSGEPGKVLD